MTKRYLRLFILFSISCCVLPWALRAQDGPGGTGGTGGADSANAVPGEVGEAVDGTESMGPATVEVDEFITEDVSATGALIEKLKESGKTGIALFFISVVGFSFAFERLFNLRKSLITPPRLAGQVDQLWSQGDVSAVKKLASESHSTLGRVINEIVEHRDSPRADITTMAGDLASREMRLHLQRAYPLAVVATISPLLGLFGTVYGMIGAFESVALAGEMGDPSIMAGDIAYALITTALGLVIAVPALASYHFFRIRTNMLALGLESQLGHIMSRWFGPNAIVPKKSTPQTPLED
ncbi:MotA/TolQ/ExbB proton channel family protein [Coraliomargarita sp. SDUM461003]|uniref:MotA/TolQ/ExbB proton channel family protein n=1 Tax=Thalassobacterium maritimum TaxID=3041265 RepID=A0ABU1AYK9_9BACT|nr:MotA/TolQ/ExbB proton channel family protein [Coraliomargarita sp. SDUM461003]MDQ8209250.1 MotA/TolQ/ExbB proton channel family protein [Coraliomargarita sp. SDUM461003]